MATKKQATRSTKASGTGLAPSKCEAAYPGLLEFHRMGQTSLRRVPGNTRYGKMTDEVRRVGVSIQVLNLARHCGHHFDTQQIKALIERARDSQFPLGKSLMMAALQDLSGEDAARKATTLLHEAIRKRWTKLELTARRRGGKPIGVSKAGRRQSVLVEDWQRQLAGECQRFVKFLEALDQKGVPWKTVGRPIEAAKLSVQSLRDRLVRASK
jgi:hypothetical protein